MGKWKFLMGNALLNECLLKLIEAETELQGLKFHLSGVIGSLNRVEYLLKKYNIERVWEVNQPRINEIKKLIEKSEKLAEETRKSIIYWMKKNYLTRKRMKEAFSKG